MSSPPPSPEQPVSGQFCGQFRAEYARRMNAVLDHINRHLDTPLDLAQLADVAHFSRFHFHRVFAAWKRPPCGWLCAPTKRY
ncbi:AraC family transcriptional regulator [Janthinobacterium sp. MDB2-8]|uniref:AraC family transcriptional regulator n=1 Tax=Janthinobacterium sp. MDB2-8 TaxID=1259338 RepID=UPI003F234584